MRGQPLETPLCGAEGVRKLNERERSGAERELERSGSGAGARAEREQSGERGYIERGVSGERKFRPLPLRSHALELATKR